MSLTYDQLRLVADDALSEVDTRRRQLLQQAEEIERLNVEREAEHTKYIEMTGVATRLEAEVASLRAELEQARIERDRETEVRRAAEKHVRDLQAYLDRVGYPDEWDQLQERAEQAERALEQVRQEIDQTWRAIDRCYEIETREYFERHAPDNGFQFPLVQAIHHIWKRDPRREESSQ